MLIRDFDEQVLDLIHARAGIDAVRELVDRIYEVGYADGESSAAADYIMRTDP